MDLIVAVDKKWGIGKNNDLLAHLPGDLKYYKEKTRGKCVIFGRRTLESLPGSKPLPDRNHIVLSNDPNFEIPLRDNMKECGEYKHSLPHQGRSAGAGRVSMKFLYAEEHHFMNFSLIMWMPYM